MESLQDVMNFKVKGSYRVNKGFKEHRIDLYDYLVWSSREVLELHTVIPTQSYPYFARGKQEFFLKDRLD